MTQSLMTTQQTVSYKQYFRSSFASVSVSLTKIVKPVQVCCSRRQEIYNFASPYSLLRVRFYVPFTNNRK